MKSAAQKHETFVKYLRHRGIDPNSDPSTWHDQEAAAGHGIDIGDLNWKPAPEPEPSPEPETEADIELFKDCEPAPPMPPRIGRKVDITVQELAELLDGDVSHNRLEVYAPGPGHSSWDRSMSVRLEPSHPDGFLVHSWGRSSWEECNIYVSELLNGVATSEISLAPSPESIAAREAAKAAAIAKGGNKWKWADRTLGQAAIDYFASRGLVVPPHMIGHVVRYQPHGRWYSAKGTITDPNIPEPYNKYDEAEILLFVARDVFTVYEEAGSGRAVQELRMPHLGKKPSRKIQGAKLNAAIKLVPHEDVISSGELAIAEGFESALAAMSFGYRNVWSLIDAQGIENFPVIGGVNKLTILGEHCEENENARLECAVRWKEAGRKVVIAMPDKGKDFNDWLTELKP